jgi:hypothetical protein
LDESGGKGGGRAGVHVHCAIVVVDSTSDFEDLFTRGFFNHLLNFEIGLDSRIEKKIYRTQIIYNSVRPCSSSAT